MIGQKELDKIIKGKEWKLDDIREIIYLSKCKLNSIDSKKNDIIIFFIKQIFLLLIYLFYTYFIIKFNNINVLVINIIIKEKYNL